MPIAIRSLLISIASVGERKNGLRAGRLRCSRAAGKSRTAPGWAHRAPTAGCSQACLPASGETVAAFPYLTSRLRKAIGAGGASCVPGSSAVVGVRRLVFVDLVFRLGKYPGEGDARGECVIPSHERARFESHALQRFVTREAADPDLLEAACERRGERRAGVAAGGGIRRSLRRRERFIH